MPAAARPRVAACGLDLLEQLPGGASHRRGQRLDVVAAAGSVGDLVEVRLFLEDQVDVAGQPLGIVETAHGQRVAAAQRGRERLGGRAQQVCPRVADALVGQRGDGVDLHPAGCIACRFERRHGLGPREARRAELSDGEEVVGADPENECNLRRHGVYRRAFFNQRGEPLHAFGERVGQFLNCRRAEFVQPVAAHGVGRNLGTLRDLPTGRSAAREGELGRGDVGLGFQAGQVLLAVVRSDLQPLVGAPHQPLLIIGALQVGFDHRFPLRCADGREFRGQVQVIGFGLRHGWRPPGRPRSGS